MVNKNEYILDFVDEQTVASLYSFIESESDYVTSANNIAKLFGADCSIISTNDEQENKKLLSSFKNNLRLLIQKTWVEKSDMASKDRLLNQLEDFFTKDTTWLSNYDLFRRIIDDAVFLMFGQPTDSDDFAEYTIRIDPEFGIFWWYISNLPEKANWSEEKCRVAMMLGMYFLANY